MIILYSTHCPRCTVLEKKLTAAGIEYKINTDTQEMLNKGFVEVPVLELETGETMNFIQANKWIGEQTNGN